MKYEVGYNRHFIITNENDCALATHFVLGWVKEVGFTETISTMIATSVSELATNITKYAGRGTISVGLICQMEQLGIEVIAEDNGPGIINRDKALQDHYSTTNSLGLGLPSIKRMMDEFLIDSSPQMGTKIVTRKWMPLS